MAEIATIIVMKQIRWSEEECGILETLYPRGAKEIILKEFRKKTWPIIQEKAEEMGLQRVVEENNTRRKKRKPRVSISKRELAELLVKRDLTIYDIAKKLKTTPDVVRRTIFKYGF